MSHADRERAVARRVATGLVVVFVALWIVRLILGIATGSLTDQPSLPLDLVFDAGAIVFSTLILLVGWAIVTRQPKNTIGWLLMTIPILGDLRVRRRRLCDRSTRSPSRGPPLRTGRGLVRPVADRCRAFDLHPALPPVPRRETPVTTVAARPVVHDRCHDDHGHPVSP
jgi:hypothetical protein